MTDVKKKEYIWVYDQYHKEDAQNWVIEKIVAKTENKIESEFNNFPQTARI